jgi:hypothetical protein
MERFYARILKEAEPDGALIVTFVHGWRHNADFDDGNIKDFRRLLYGLQGIESYKALGAAAGAATRRQAGGKHDATWPMPYSAFPGTPNDDGRAILKALGAELRPRRVIGVYVEWRGAGVHEFPEAPNPHALATF